MAAFASPSVAEVLVVEDGPAMAALYQAFLEQDGYQVAIAGTGAEALAVLRHDPPEVMVLDLNLPGPERPRDTGRGAAPGLADGGDRGDRGWGDVDRDRRHARRCL